MHDNCRFVGVPLRGVGLASVLLAGVSSLALSSSAEAGTLTITPVFASSITGNANAAAIEGAINSAIGTIDGLYSTGNTATNAAISVNFSFNPGAAGNLLSTNQTIYGYTYASYVAALTADKTANPSNTNLTTAVANLGFGNNPGPNGLMLITGAQSTLLGGYRLSPSLSNASININSNVSNWSFMRPVTGGSFDAIGGLEHELNEVLGGGGAGSTLNIIKGSCGGVPSATFPCNTQGATDLYRYSGLHTPSFTTSSTASSFLSINGGATSVVAFNQNSGGDYGDFAPPGTGAGQLIQNAFNSTGQDEAYTTSSPEYVMEEAIGWDPHQVAVPAPRIGFGLAAFLAVGGLLFGARLLERRRRGVGPLGAA